MIFITNYVLTNQSDLSEHECQLNDKTRWVNVMAESEKVKTSMESLKLFLSEKLKDYDTVVISEDKNIYLAGVVGIIQSLTMGLIPIYIARSVIELKNIKQKLGETACNAFYIFDCKHNQCDDEPRNEQIVFNWIIDNDQLLITSSHRLIGEVRHKGLQI